MKRLFSGFLLGLLCLSMFFVFAPKVGAQQSTVDWWPTFRHDLIHTSSSTSTAPLTNQVLWNYTTGDSVAYSSPAILNGVVYVGSNDHYVYALNAATGTYIWSYKTGSSVDSSPAVADGVVYVGSDDNNIYALNATTGNTVWTYGTTNIVDSSPAVANGVVYIGSTDHNVYAFGAVTVAQPSPPVPSPTVPEFPSQALAFSLVAVMVCAAFALIAKRKAHNRKNSPTFTSCASFL